MKTAYNISVQWKFNETQLRIGEVISIASNIPPLLPAPVFRSNLGFKIILDKFAMTTSSRRIEGRGPVIFPMLHRTY